MYVELVFAERCGITSERLLSVKRAREVGRSNSAAADAELIVDNCLSQDVAVLCVIFSARPMAARSVVVRAKHQAGYELEALTMLQDVLSASERAHQQMRRIHKDLVDRASKVLSYCTSQVALAVNDST